MRYFAHTRENGEKQLLKEHLNGTAALAESFAIAPLKISARLTGLLHDLGKYQPGFQKRLDGGASVDHSVCGAKEAKEIFDGNAIGDIFAYIAAGHHAGLPDRGNEGENENSSTLAMRLKKSCEDYSAWQSEITLPDKGAVINELVAFFGEKDFAEKYQFLIRYLYSCLTDADFLDTERFVAGRKREHKTVSWAECSEALKQKISSFTAATDVQKARAELQRQALSHAEETSPIYLLDMPTGSGKTLCSLAFALRRARLTGKKRIIYVIPYTSIIEQTAQILEELFPDVPVLRHSSNIDYDELIREALHGKPEDYDSEDIRVKEILKKATENWDVPIIVTTNVQFFESIYGNRSGKLRKLHNMAESMLVFDEIHMLPVSWFIPCMQAVEQLTNSYCSEALFLTATMPDFAALTQDYLGHALPVLDLISDKSLYSIFETSIFEDIGDTPVFCRIDGTQNTLVVCNRKQTTEELYNAYPGANKYCLSTYLTPRDRSRIIKEIGDRIKNTKEDASAEPVTVFSTSLIEAGVDLDFDVVMREYAGLENILQTAGRCNREGTRAREESKVYLFTTEHAPRGELQIRANVARDIIRKNGTGSLRQARHIREYFDIVCRAERHAMKDLSGPRGKDPRAIDFKKIAEEFRLIDTTTVGIIIPNEQNAAEIAALKAGHGNLRRLQKDSATVNFGELKRLIGAGVISEWNGTFVLERPDLYSKCTGLRISEALGNDIIC